MALYLHLSIALKQTLRASFHEFYSSSFLLCSVQSARDPLAGRDRAGGWLVRSLGLQDSLSSAEAQLCQEARGYLLVEGMKAARGRQKGKALTGKKGSSRTEEKV